MVSTKPRASSERIYDERTALVKELVAKESAALDAKTARLKALRMARDEEADPLPDPPKPRKKKSAVASPKPKAKLGK